MKHFILPFLGLTLLASCGDEGMFRSAEAPQPVVRTEGGDMRPQSRPDAEADVEAEAEAEAEADADTPAATAQSGGTLGTTIASLGDPAEGGAWLKTPLVTTQQSGTISVAGGASTTVTLIPIAGPATAGSRISLQAMQALGVPLTSLPEVTVTAG